ncbi:MAG: antibiotic biosynthesis monooxygenase [Bacteroidetes bacterium]|nr:antibiotic biosynthesis monooxygenase [Bacteroidota bacterium]
MKIETTLRFPYLNDKFRKFYNRLLRISGLRHGLFLILAASIPSLLFFDRAAAQEKNKIVRLAKLQIDPAQLENYKTMLKEEIETSVRVEPGVLTLNAVSEKDNPTHITILEIYADQDAYKAHIASPHFLKYKSGTKDMVKSLELVETVPVALASKNK